MITKKKKKKIFFFLLPSSRSFFFSSLFFFFFFFCSCFFFFPRPSPRTFCFCFCAKEEPSFSQRFPALPAPFKEGGKWESKFRRGTNPGLRRPRPPTSLDVLNGQAHLFFIHRRCELGLERKKERKKIILFLFFSSTPSRCSQIGA